MDRKDSKLPTPLPKRTLQKSNFPGDKHTTTKPPKTPRDLAPTNGNKMNKQNGLLKKEKTLKIG